MFFCLSFCVINLEIATSYETHTFLLELRRFIGSRGNNQYMPSDKGGNFVVASKELRKSLQEMNHKCIQQHRETIGVRLIWAINPPITRHMGNFWNVQS